MGSDAALPRRAAPLSRSRSRCPRGERARRARTARRSVRASKTRCTVRCLPPHSLPAAATSVNPRWRRARPRRCCSPRPQSGDVALVFGREASGLTREQVNLCQRIVHIPANPDYSSLNLAAAVQIMTYELRVAAGAGTLHAPEVHEPATFEEVEAFHVHLDEVMRETGFLDPRTPRRLTQRMRRLFTRARLGKGRSVAAARAAEGDTGAGQATKIRRQSLPHHAGAHQGRDRRRLDGPGRSQRLELPVSVSRCYHRLSSRIWRMGSSARASSPHRAADGSKSPGPDRPRFFIDHGMASSSARREIGDDCTSTTGHLGGIVEQAATDLATDRRPVPRSGRF